jgi:hypothetical protein
MIYELQEQYEAEWAIKAPIRSRTARKRKQREKKEEKKRKKEKKKCPLSTLWRFFEVLQLA